MDPITLAVLVLVVLVLVPVVVIWQKGRSFAQGDVFRASRLSAGNRLFPTQVLITPQSVVHFTPQWIGRLEHSIHMAHVASVSIDTNLMFSDVYIETTGGTTPIHCKGHSKSDALEMKRLIEQYQTSYYQQRPQESEPPQK
ncbi:MAG: PH domain-containing protein [Acidobacteria bacterium]|nr:PH domain-containing protein [Acidobacteriota bacterium]